jgi:hypothetical protein
VLRAVATLMYGQLERTTAEAEFDRQVVALLF